MRKAFTLVELLVVVAIIALLLGILLPALSKAKEVARRSVCMSSLNQMSTATFAYATANKGWTPDWGGLAAADMAKWFTAARNLQHRQAPGPVVIGKTMEYEFLPVNPAITYCPSRNPEGRYAERARNYGWINWGSDLTNWELGNTIEYSYQHRLARQLGEVNAGEAFGGDLAIIDNYRIGNGPSITMSVGAQIAHGDEYYNVAFFDNSVRPVFDKDEEFYDPSLYFNAPGLALDKLQELD